MSSQQDSLFYLAFHLNALECNALKPEMSSVTKPLTLSEWSINNLCSPLNLIWENHLAWVEGGNERVHRIRFLVKLTEAVQKSRIRSWNFLFSIYT